MEDRNSGAIEWVKFSELPIEFWFILLIIRCFAAISPKYPRWRQCPSSNSVFFLSREFSFFLSAHSHSHDQLFPLEMKLSVKN